MKNSESQASLREHHVVSLNVAFEKKVIHRCGTNVKNIFDCTLGIKSLPSGLKMQIFKTSKSIKKHFSLFRPLLEVTKLGLYQIFNKTSLFLGVNTNEGYNTYI